MRIEQKLDFGPVTGLRMGHAPIGKPLMSVICYQLDNVLIDTGAKNARLSLLRMVDIPAVEKVYLTHYHEDHAGNAAYLKKEHGLPIFGHTLTQAALSSRTKLKPYERYMWGDLEPTDISSLEDSFASERYRFRVFHTPGHSHDHVVFLEPDQGWLFSGDMYLGTRIKYFRKDEDILQTIESLKFLTTLEFDRLFCGHNPKMQQAKIYLQRKVNHLEDIYDDVKKLKFRGWPPKKIINKLIKSKESWLAKAITCGDVSYRNMLVSAINCIERSKDS